MSPHCFRLLFFSVLTSVVSAQSASPFASGVWCGAVTGTSANVVVRLTSAGVPVRLQVGKTASLSPSVFSVSATTAAASGNTVTLTVQGLTANTDYFYGVEVAGVLRTEAASRGRFHTFPLGSSSFRIGFASCSDNRHADQTAFDAIVRENPVLFIHMGDLHYDDINSTEVNDYRAAFDRVLNQPNESAMYRSMAVAYMWDDHDFCGDNSDGTSIGRDTVRTVYQERAPHYPIAANVGGTMAQAFTIGRVRVILTDQRSASDPPETRESPTKTRLGAAQKAWFKQELIDARDAGWPLILWVSTAPWIAPALLGDDTWGGYATERTEIANFIRDNRITNLVMLAGDMHALAYDDGTHSDYATGGGAPFPVLHAAALTAPGEIKGGPYTAGPLPGSQQYGILEVYDTGGPSVSCRYLGMKVSEGAKLTYTFGATALATRNEQTLVNISTLARVTSPNDVIVAGFVISGSTPRTVLMRAAGPTLATFGLADALTQPHLVAFQGDQRLASNDGWATDDATAQRLVTAFDRAGAFRFADKTTRDAALLLTLAPGVYTLRVSSGSGAPGATLVEVYDVLP